VIYEAIKISVLNSNNTLYKEYRVTASEPKVVIDLTADLAIARPGKEITSLQVKESDHPTRTADQFYQDCINILTNVFISYSYTD
jgi:hypothetical protein